MSTFLLALAELLIDPLDKLLRLDADPLEMVRRPEVMGRWQAMTDHDKITSLANRAWDSRIVPLPKTEAEPDTVTYAAGLHDMAGLVAARVECEDRIRALGLPDPTVSLGADVLLLAAIRQDVIANETRGCPVCRQPWPPHPGAGGTWS